MPKWYAPRAVAAAVVGLALAGCGQSPQGTEPALSTSGPNQVVIKVPGMT